jgi:hypothetical protein
LHCKKSSKKVPEVLDTYGYYPYLYIIKLKERDMKNVKEFVAAELKGLERGFIATPESREQLEAFAKANQGSMDIVLMQMAIQFGAKLALENVQEALGK